MTNSEFYTRALDIIDNYIMHLPVDTEKKAYYAIVASNIGCILLECKTNYISQKEFLFIIRHHFTYKTSYISTIKEAYRTFYRELKELSLEDHPLSDTVQTLREQGYNTYE